MKKDTKKKDEGAGREKDPIAILRNNKGKFISYIYEEDEEFFSVDAGMVDYYVERLEGVRNIEKNSY